MMPTPDGLWNEAEACDQRSKVDEALLAQIADRRSDTEFMARLDRIMAEVKPVLDALQKAGD